MQTAAKVPGIVLFCSCTVFCMPMQELVSFLDFKFDPSSGDLLRGERRLRMPKQTSRLLGIFLERQGSVVSRAELQELLWPDGEFLDHEHAINRVITDLRAVFRDNPKSPRYIETVHKRGYRFLPVITTLPVDRPLQPSIEGGSLAQADLLLDVTASGEQGQLVVMPAPLFGAASDSEQSILPPVQRSERGLRHYHWLIVAAIAVSAVIVAVTAGMYWRGHRPGTSEASVLSMGIAPFETDGPGAREMAESLRLDLADALAQLPVVQIRAMNSLSNVSRDDNSIRNLSETLHLDVLLLGTLRIQGDHCTFAFELVRGRDSLHMASFQYEGSKEELAGIRDRLQRDIFLSLQGKGKSMQAIRGSTDDPQAYGEYLEGRELTRLRDPDALKQAIGHYQNAIQRDPKFAGAYAGMASAHLALRYFSNAEEHQQAAKQLAEQALQLDPQIAEAHAALGDVALRSAWDFALGERELRRAIELDPHKATYHAWLASLLVYEGRFDEAISEIDRAVADDPLWPLVYSMATYVVGMAHDNNRAIAFASKYLSLFPDSPESHNQLGWAYFCARRYDEALTEWGRMAEMDKDPARIALEERGREAYQQGGIQAYARTRINAMEVRSPETLRRSNDFAPAEWYAFTGQRDKAIASLERIVANHDSQAILLAVNPMLDSLHDDPRFRSLLHQVGLTLPNYAHRASR